MTTLFILCAVIGSTVLITQFVLSIVGLTDAGVDLVDDLPSDGDVEFGHGDTGHGDGFSHDTHWSSTWLFGVLSFRTIVAALTFFGLSGMAAHSAGMSLGAQLSIATISGLAAMYAIYGLMRAMFKLTQDGSLHIERALGKTGTVYLSIPAAKAGLGKVHLSVQQRLVEYAAITSAPEKLPAGAKVVVTGIVGRDTLEVALVEPSRAKPQLSTETV